MKELEDFERFLVFMAVVNTAQPIDRLIKAFARITGWEENRARSAFEVCAVKGFIGTDGPGLGTGGRS